MTTDLISQLPLLFLSAWACALLLVDLAVPPARKAWTAILALVGLAIAAALVVIRWPAGEGSTAFAGMLAVDGFAAFLHLVVLASAAVGVVLARNHLPRLGIERGEAYSLLLFSVAGTMLMASAADLIVVFLGLELLSIPLYVLSGLARPEAKSEESALKYFLLGAFASGFLVYGIALAYGATQTTNLARVAQALVGASTSDPLLLAGAGLILVGLGFKVAAVPFHMWTPDVYEGAPSAVTAYMSVGAKVGGVAALLRVFGAALPDLAVHWTPVMVAVAALTMIVGNVVAIAQRNVKRLLAYSSIAHAGYLLMALPTNGGPAQAEAAAGSALFYLLAYAATNLGAWAVVMALERAEGKGLDIGDYAGLGTRRPAMALAMAAFMLSLTGLPPTAGFVAKVYVFRVALEAGQIGLAIVGVLTSLVSAYYYLRIVMIMYMQPGEPQVVARPSLSAAIGVTALVTLVLGVLPGPLLALAARSVQGFWLGG